MRGPAQQFLTLRAFGAPPIVIALAAQGTFRGFKDTKTPLYAVGKYCSSFLPTSLSIYVLICYIQLNLASSSCGSLEKFQSFKFTMA